MRLNVDDTTDITGMYTDYDVAEEAVYTLGQLAGGLRDQLEEHSDADPRWKKRLAGMRELSRRMLAETEALYSDWLDEIEAQDA